MELSELAQNYFGDTRSGSLAGPVGAFIVLALAVTTVLLIRNMNARIRRLRNRFPDGFPDRRDGPDGSPDRPDGLPDGGADPGPNPRRRTS
ncbi:MAG: hypothetical protein GEV12_16075 [Micromonosporaceae bacterium]|nr:hypothetical protein [Micromonosporaceae bacterium]